MVVIEAQYVDVYTGPGRGYPIHHVLEKGETVELLKQRTSWIKVLTRKGKTGWVKVTDINQSVGANGELVNFTTPSMDQFLSRKYELGFAGGDFEGSESISLYAGWRFSRNLSTELHATQIVGQFSDSQMLTANIVLQPFPERRLSPFVTLGSGVIRISPDATLVDTEDRDNNVMQVGIGVYGYITRRFVARFQYNNNTLLTDRDENEEINEWKIGLTAFF
nr:SH3 domain-containing protein [Marinibactrum halimedae]